MGSNRKYYVKFKKIATNSSIHLLDEDDNFLRSFYFKHAVLAQGDSNITLVNFDSTFDNVKEVVEEFTHDSTTKNVRELILASGSTVDASVLTNKEVAEILATEFFSETGATATAGFLGYGATADRPSGLSITDTGKFWFDTDLERPVYWTGSEWDDNY
jgi:hypothetical protein